LGDFAPKLVDLTDGVLFRDIWELNELSPRDRSLVTVASLITRGSTDQLRGYLSGPMIRVSDLRKGGTFPNTLSGRRTSHETDRCTGGG
jgi:alkylhydroperoxidase/carboxymuconolactone decarboxylase family protein YurZ